MGECVYFCCGEDLDVRDIFVNISMPLKSVFVDNQQCPADNFRSSLFVYHCSEKNTNQDSYGTYNNDNNDDIEKITKLRTLYPATPIILTTRKRSAVVAVWALRWKISDLILIPDELEYLHQRINDIIETRALDKKLASAAGNDFLTNANRVDKLLSSTYKTSNAIQYIERFYWRKITVQELAGLCSMSTQSFSRYFKLEKGMTVREYIKNYRISIAVQLLIDDSISIQQIAYKTGFDDASHFNRIFKSIQSVTPSTYRTTYRTTHGAKA